MSNPSPRVVVAGGPAAHRVAEALLDGGQDGRRPVVTVITEEPHRPYDCLQRTARWQEELPGGIDHVREVAIADALGICDELERDMQHVDGYTDEWAETLAGPQLPVRLAEAPAGGPAREAG